MGRLGLTPDQPSMTKLVSPSTIATSVEIANSSLFPAEAAPEDDIKEWMLDDQLLCVDKDKPEDDPTRTLMIGAIDMEQVNDKLYFNLTIEGLPVTAQLDSGAAACAMSEDIFNNIPNR